MRQIVLDTETTGLDPKSGHRIIEIGCIELVNRRITDKTFHYYLNPGRMIEKEAEAVHGITNAFLKDKPLFKDIAEDLYFFIQGAELIIHNAPFDVGFLDHEFGLLKQRYKPIKKFCGICDTLILARQKHPGQRNSLDALCKRYHVDNSNRDLHGALLDSELLAQVYLLMTGGQASLFGGDEESLTANRAAQSHHEELIQSINHQNRAALPVVKATAQEQAAHAAFMAENLANKE